MSKLPMDYFPRVLLAIDFMGQGETQTAACAKAGLTVSTFRKYVAETQEIHELFADAEQRGYDTLADRLVGIIEYGDNEGITEVQKLKLLSDNIKWFLARKRPQQYGDKTIHEHNITADRAIIDALDAGRQRALEGRVLEGVAYTVVEQITHHKAGTPYDVTGLDPDLLEFL